MKKKLSRMVTVLAMILMIALMAGMLPASAEQANKPYTAIVTEATAVFSDEQCATQAGSLEQYDAVLVTGISGTIARIRYQGYTLYIDASAVTDVKELSTPAKITEATYVFEDADITTRSLPIREGTPVNVIAVSGQWAMIEYNGNVGYTYKGYLSEVTADETAEPDDSEDPIVDNSEEELTGKDTEIGGNGLNAKSVTVQTISATVTAKSLPVYQSASTRSAKMGTLKKGTTVTVYAYNKSWAYIGMDGKYGFTALKGLSKIGAAVTPTPTPNIPDKQVDASDIAKATVSVDKLKVYASASTSSKVLGTLGKDLEVNVVKTSGKWAYIELDGHYGFCAISGLTSSEAVETPNSNQPSNVVVDGVTALGTCTVVTATAPVYKTASTTAAYTTVKMGTTYSYYRYNSKWVMVGDNGKAAYIPIQYLNADHYAELKREDDSSAVTTLNRALQVLGYFDEDISSSYSAETVNAVKRMQAACGMTETGTADVALLRVLYSGNAPASPMLNATLSSGDKNDMVSRLQTRLYALGYFSKSSSIDGSFGTTTTKAIKLFQTAAGISATGKADKATIKALYNPSAPSMPSSSDAADAESQVAPPSSGGSTTTTTQISSQLASTTTTYNSGMSNAQKLEYVIYNAQQQLGKRYVYGATGTSTFDCSGLTMYAFGKIGVSLPHSAYSQGYNDKYTKLSSTSAMRRGDLIFFNTVSDSDLCDHVGIYLGNYYFIHASSGAGKVVVSNVSSGYYNRVFSWGRRILA